MRTLLLAATLALAGASGAQEQTPSKPDAGQGQGASNEAKNIRAYIELLRTDVKKFKSQIMGEVMELDTDEAAKFWPVYKDFDAEYSALGEQIVAVIRDYAKNYDNMTDKAADNLAGRVLSIEDQRNALKKKYYERLKAELGAITAARFLQVENQLERLIDLQVAAELPVVSQR
jgi:hypothetical protein